MQRRGEDDSFAIVGNRLYQCPDGYRLYYYDYGDKDAKDNQYYPGGWQDFGVYIGPQDAGSTRDLHDRGIREDGPLRFVCITEQ